jgi:hypothetical protein
MPPGTFDTMEAMNPSQDLATSTLLRGCQLVKILSKPGGGDSPWLGKALQGETETIGGSEGFHWTSDVCVSQKDLQQTLHGASAIGGGLSILPIPMIQAQKAFSESIKSTVFSVSLVVQAKRVLERYGVKNPTWDSNLRSVPTNLEELDGFVSECGDSWVSSISVGGAIQGVYTLFAQSQQQAREVSEKLNLMVAGGGISLGPSLSRSLQTLSEELNVNRSFRVAISGLAQPPSITEADLEAFARGFGSTELDKPAILSLETAGYEQLAALRQAFAPVAQNRKLLYGDGISEGVLERRQKLLAIQSQCQWVADTYRIYGIPEDPSLAMSRRAIKQDIETIDGLCSAYLTTPSSPLTAPDLPSLEQGSPNLQVTISEGDVMGNNLNNGGSPFPYRDRENAIRRRRRLVRVGLRCGSRVDQIRLLYQQEPKDSPDAMIQEKHGAPNDKGGDDKGEIELASGISIQRIEAKTGVPAGRVDKLWLTASDGQRIGGGGNAGNTELDWRPAPDQVLLGFRGRSGSEVDSLCAVIATFGPLRWEQRESE